MEEHGGVVPGTLEGLTAFQGVGPKIAALTLAVGFNRPAIAVDIHVHRITNRWGYVATSAPEATMAALAVKLPEKYWIEINARLVPFVAALVPEVDLSGGRVVVADRPGLVTPFPEEAEEG